MKPVVDRDLCIGCGLCEDICPEVFRLEDDGNAIVINDDPGAELYGSVRDATESCPTDAITITE